MDPDRLLEEPPRGLDAIQQGQWRTDLDLAWILRPELILYRLAGLQRPRTRIVRQPVALDFVSGGLAGIEEVGERPSVRFVVVDEVNAASSVQPPEPDRRRVRDAKIPGTEHPVTRMIER